MFLNSACTKTGKPDATVTEAQPLAKARNKKNLCTLIPDLKKIYVFICISNKCVSLEQDIFLHSTESYSCRTHGLNLAESQR